MNIKKYLHIKYLLVFALIIIFCTALFWLVKDSYSFYHSTTTHTTSQLLQKEQSQKPTIPPEKIQSWMTFKYINYVFNLPPTFLQMQLNISDQKYPNMTLDKYAKNNGINTAKFLQSVKILLSKQTSEAK